MVALDYLSPKQSQRFIDHASNGVDSFVRNVDAPWFWKNDYQENDPTHPGMGPSLERLVRPSKRRVPDICIRAGPGAAGSDFMSGA